MSRNVTEVPESWHPLMNRRGFTYRGKPSMGALATKSGVHKSTISRAMRNVGQIDPATVQALADALEVPAAEVRQLIDGADQSPFVAHRDADLLSTEERDAVNELIRLFALKRKQTTVGGEGDGDAAPSKTPDLGPADQPRLKIVAEDNTDDIQGDQEKGQE